MEITFALRTADILFKDKPAGSLQETAEGGTRFVYRAEWRESIACCLPADRREHEWKTGLHPFFQHLGPEGWLREQQARVAHIAEEDDLGLLLRYGADCIGAVSVRSPNGVAALPPVTEATASPGRTVSGVQRKLLVVRDGHKFKPAEPIGPAPFIAKFNSEGIPTLVRNEALSLKWTAAVLGAAEVNTFTVSLVADEAALIVTRFDRKPDGEKLRLEDFAQILCKPRGQDYRGKYEATYEEVAEVIKTHSVRPVIDLARFFRRLVAFAVVGNCDAHLKNFSLVEGPVGLRLAPAYDIVNTTICPEYDQIFGLSIEGKERQLDTVTGELLRKFGLSVGLPAAAVERIFAELQDKARKATQSVLKPPQGEGPDGFVTRFKETVSGQCLRILGK